MTYKQYSQALNAVLSSIDAAQRENAATEKNAEERRQLMTSQQKAVIASLKESQRQLESSYGDAASLLTSKDLASLRYSLPSQVRANSASQADAQQSVQVQSRAVKRLTSGVQAYRSEVKRQREAEEARRREEAAREAERRREEERRRRERAEEEARRRAEAERIARRKAEAAALKKAKEVAPLSRGQKDAQQKAPITVGQLPRVWWMLGWRISPLALVTYPEVQFGVAIVLLLSLVIAFLITVVGCRTLTPGPFRALKNKRPLFVTMPQFEQLKESRKGTPEAVIPKASAPGIMTGLEPRELKDTPLTGYPKMFGTPGHGLGDSGFDNWQIKAGVLGEKGVAQALAKTGLLERYASFWSVHMLGQDGYSKEEYDLDCAIVTGKNIWLIDCKYYASGDVLFCQEENKLYSIDAATGMQVGKPKQMSKNMQMAVDRFNSRYHKYRGLELRARVVVVPTDSGMAKIDDVKWPGGIPLVSLPEFIAELSEEPPFGNTLDSELVSKTFQGLVKN